jgi:hypothetical protein
VEPSTESRSPLIYEARCQTIWTEQPNPPSCAYLSHMWHPSTKLCSPLIYAAVCAQPRPTCLRLWAAWALLVAGGPVGPRKLPDESLSRLDGPPRPDTSPPALLPFPKFSSACEGDAPKTLLTTRNGSRRHGSPGSGRQQTLIPKYPPQRAIRRSPPPTSSRRHPKARSRLLRVNWNCTS